MINLYHGMPGHIENKEHIEMNTGIKFPGVCLESVLTSSLSIG